MRNGRCGGTPGPLIPPASTRARSLTASVSHSCRYGDMNVKVMSLPMTAIGDQGITGADAADRILFPRQGGVVPGGGRADQVGEEAVADPGSGLAVVQGREPGLEDLVGVLAGGGHRTGAPAGRDHLDGCGQQRSGGLGLEVEAEATQVVPAV